MTDMVLFRPTTITRMTSLPRLRGLKLNFKALRKEGFPFALREAGGAFLGRETLLTGIALGGIRMAYRAGTELFGSTGVVTIGTFVPHETSEPEGPETLFGFAANRFTQWLDDHFENQDFGITWITGLDPVSGRLAKFKERYGDVEAWEGSNREANVANASIEDVSWLIACINASVLSLVGEKVTSNNVEIGKADGEIIGKSLAAGELLKALKALGRKGASPYTIFSSMTETTSLGQENESSCLVERLFATDNAHDVEVMTWKPRPDLALLKI